MVKNYNKYRKNWHKAIIIFNFIIFVYLFFCFLEDPINEIYIQKNNNVLFMINFILSIIAALSIKAHYTVSKNDDLYLLYLFFLNLSIGMGVRLLVSTYDTPGISNIPIGSLVFRNTILLILLFRKLKPVKRSILLIKNNMWIFNIFTVALLILDIKSLEKELVVCTNKQILSVCIVSVTVFAILYNLKKSIKYDEEISCIISMSFVFISISHMYRLSSYIYKVESHKWNNVMVEELTLFLGLSFIIVGIIVQGYRLIEVSKAAEDKYNLFFTIVNENDNDSVFIYEKNEIIYANKKAKKDLLGDENYAGSLNVLKYKMDRMNLEESCFIGLNKKISEGQNSKIILIDDKNKVYTVSYQAVKNNQTGYDDRKMNVFMSRDITNEIKNERERYINDKKFKIINDNVDEFIFIVDENLNITYVNRQCEKVIGKSQSELIGNKLSKYIDVKDIINTCDCIDFEKPLLSSINIKIEQIREDDKLIGYVIVCSKEDMSEMNEFIDIIGSNNNSHGDNFVNLSHELRTPIHIIYSSLQLLSSQKENMELSEFAKMFDRYDGVIKINCLRLLKLINDIIDVNKLDTGSINYNKKVYNIVSLVENIAESVIPYMGTKNIDFVFDTEIEERYIECDQEKIERIFLNLISNAIKFTDENGEISISVDFTDEWVKISVKDNGSGISKNNINKIFNRYVQDDNNTTTSKGSGIGLALVKSFVEMHGGKIELNSILGQGSEFIVYIPNSSDEDNYKYMMDLTRVEVALVGDVSVEFSDIEI